MRARSTWDCCDMTVLASARTHKVAALAARFARQRGARRRARFRASVRRAHLKEWPRWPLASLASAARAHYKARRADYTLKIKRSREGLSFRRLRAATGFLDHEGANLEQSLVEDFGGL